MIWNFAGDRPIYAQITEQIKRAVVSGVLEPGARLPSVRDLAREAGVNPNTMQRALAELERGGLVYSQRTSGRFITEDDEFISSLRAELADEQIRGFLDSMLRLGYTTEKTAELITNYERTEENE